MASLVWNSPDVRSLAIKEFLYTKNYAAVVHEGSEGKPARPWLMTAALEFDFPKVFAEKMGSAEISTASLERAWETTITAFEQYLHEEFSNERWLWPRETKRRSGELAGSPRDIVDSGELRDSLEVADA